MPPKLPMTKPSPLFVIEMQRMRFPSGGVPSTFCPVARGQIVLLACGRTTKRLT